MGIESIHGVFEWFLMVFIVLSGFAVNRWMPFRNARYPFYLILLLTAFIFDLNKISFKSDALNLVYYLLILVIIAETFWICVRKKSKLLLCGGFAVLTPVFLYTFAAMLLIMPLPCHEINVELYDEYSGCNGKTYTLTKRLSFDPFSPAQVYILTRNIKNSPLRKQVDKFPAPKGYIETPFVPKWECKENGLGKVHLFIDGYTLWSLEEKTEEEKEREKETVNAQKRL